MARSPDDRGQAFPIYIVAVTGFLLAALALVVVGMAGVIRSDAQGAADAAALAAAGEARDKVFGGLNLADLKPADWEKILEGEAFDTVGACAKAASLAARNEATATCDAKPPKFTVTVITERTIGSSVVPGTGGAHGKAAATALIKPRCSLGAAPTPPLPPDGEPPKPDPVNISCDGDEDIILDPLNPGQLPKLARVLFSVRLID